MCVVLFMLNLILRELLKYFFLILVIQKIKDSKKTNKQTKSESKIINKTKQNKKRLLIPTWK